MLLPTLLPLLLYYYYYYYYCYNATTNTNFTNHAAITGSTNKYVLHNISTLGSTKKGKKET